MTKQTKELLYVLSETAYAEFGSALEMLAACKVADSPNLAYGYLMHSRDEYRHTNIFLSLIEKIGSSSDVASKENRFTPNAVISKGYVSSKGYLVETMSEKRFVEFVYSNELLAKDSFDRLLGLMKNHEDRISIQSIMNDEIRHHSLAKKYYLSKYSQSFLSSIFLREKAANKARKMYKRNLQFLDRIFKPLFLLLVFISVPILSAISTNGLRIQTKNLMEGRLDSML